MYSSFILSGNGKKTMSHAKTEKRKAERFGFPSRKIEYALEPETAGEVFTGITINISTGGLGLYAFEPHPEGQRLLIKSTLPVEHRVATIRWIKEEHKDLYKLGVMFSDLASGFRKGL